MLKKYLVTCKKCGKQFEVECSEQNYLKGKYSHYCSISCRNSHNISEEVKNNISKGLHEYYGEPQKNYCKICGKEIINGGRHKQFCSEECKKISRIIPTLIKYYTFDRSLLGTDNAIAEYNRVRQMLYDDYWVNNLTGGDIARKYNYTSSVSNICGKLFNSLNIPHRNNSDTTKLNMLSGKLKFIENNQYHSEWHTTWNGKEVFLRSSYELDYAKELDEQKIDYDVECLRIKYWNTQKNDYHCAIPDFYLKDSNTIVEIKSNYTLDIQEMKDKVKAYKEQGYNFKLILEHKEVDIE